MIRAENILSVKAFTLCVLQQHINEGVVDDDPPALSSFLRLKKVTVSPPSFKMYRVEIALHSLSIATQSHLTRPHSIPALITHSNVPNMVISIPGPILESAIPTLVQQFTGRVLPTAAQPEPVRFLLLLRYGLMLCRSCPCMCRPLVSRMLASWRTPLLVACRLTTKTLFLSRTLVVWAI